MTPLARAAAIAALAQLGFAAKAIFIKRAYLAAPNLDAITFLALRMLLSLPFFIVLAWWGQRARGGNAKPAPLTRGDWLRIAYLGFIGYYLASFLDFWGLQYISAALERLILFTNPTLVVLISALLTKQRISRRTALALAISYLGLLLAYWHDIRLTSDTRALMIGSGLVFASAVAYALYLIGGGEITKRVGSTRFTAYMMGVATVFVLLHFVVARPVATLTQLAPAVWGYGVAIALFSTVLPVWMMAEALKRLGASEASIFGTIGPVFTIALGVIFLNEQVSLVQLLGAALTIGGVTLMTMRKR